MLTLEIYSYVLEIPIDAYTALSQLAVQHSVKSTANWLVDVGKYWEGNFEHYYTTVFCVQKWFIKAEHWGTFIEMSQIKTSHYHETLKTDGYTGTRARYGCDLEQSFFPGLFFYV